MQLFIWCSLLTHSQHWCAIVCRYGSSYIFWKVSILIKNYKGSWGSSQNRDIQAYSQSTFPSPEGDTIGLTNVFPSIFWWSWICSQLRYHPQVSALLLLEGLIFSLYPISYLIVHIFLLLNPPFCSLCISLSFLHLLPKKQSTLNSFSLIGPSSVTSISKLCGSDLVTYAISAWQGVTDMISKCSTKTLHLQITLQFSHL